MTTREAHPAAGTGAGGSPRSVGAMAAIIVGAVLVAYAGTFAVPWLFDDTAAILDNPSIRGPWELARFVSPPVDTPVAGRPLLNLTFAVNHAISGLDPWSYHALNLLIHLAAALTLFGVVRRTLLTPTLQAHWAHLATWVAGSCALLWSVHPVQTQSVTYISQRAESLMALCYLATLYCFIRGVESRPGRWHALAVVACLLGALSKQVIMTAPLMVLLYDRAFVTGSFSASLRRRKIFYAALAATWLVVGWSLLEVRRRGVGFSQGVSALDYALTQCDAITVYLRLCLWPRPLIFDRGAALVASLGQVLPQILLLAGAFGLVAWAWIKRPRLGFVGMAFFLLLAPTSSVVPVAGATLAENRVYLPLAAVVVLAVLALHAVLRVRWVQVIGGLLAVVAAAGTILRNRDYVSAVGLWSQTVAAVPGNARAHNNLALLLAKIPGRQGEALVHYTEALRLQPEYAEAHNNLANLLSLMPGRQGEALAHYAEALRLNPNYAAAHNNLANVLSGSAEHRSEALTHYTEALRLKPDLAEAHNNLASLLAAMPGRQAEALAHYAEALRLNPSYAEAHNNLASLLAARPERRGEALAHYTEALRLQPNYPEAHFNLAVWWSAVPAGQGEALAHYREAIRLRPLYAEAHHNLANRLAELPGRQAEALVHYREAARLLPNHPVVQFKYARQWEIMGGERAEVAALYLKAASLDPGFSAAREAWERLRQ